MKRKLIITILTITVLLVGLFACGKSDDIEPVMSSAIETDDEAESIIEKEPEQEVKTVEPEQVTQETETDPEPVEELTEAETDYFQEAAILYEEHKDELDCNKETFQATYNELRLDVSTKEEALEELLERFKIVVQEEAPASKPAEEQPQQQPQQSSNNNTVSGLTPEQQAARDRLLNNGTLSDNLNATDIGNGFGGVVNDYGNITAE